MERLAAVLHSARRAHLAGGLEPTDPGERPPVLNSLSLDQPHKLRPARIVMRERHIMHGHFWSPSHFAASCGSAPLNIIRQYTEQQRHPAQATPGLTRP
jgi:hypothetical protein